MRSNTTTGSWVKGPARTILCAAPLLLWTLSSAFSSDDAFKEARAVWPAGRSLERNLQVTFRAIVTLASPRDVVLRVSASTVYRATVNGQHAGYGPARGPHGYYRTDAWEIERFLKEGKNVVAVEVAGYNVNSYYTIDQPSFLQAEIIQGQEVLAATGKKGFDAAISGERVQKAQRYSFQRPFSEVYRLRPDHGAWLSDPDAPFAAVPCAIDERKLNYIPRRAPYPDFSLRCEPTVIGSGTVVPISNPGQPWKDRSLTAIGPQLKGYAESELEIVPSLELQKVSCKPTPASPPAKLRAGEPLTIGAQEFRLLDFGINATGFLGATVSCQEPSRLVFAFDEVLRDGTVDFKRLGCVNLVWYELPPGRFSIETFEPYTLRYLQPIVLAGKCSIQDVLLRNYACSGTEKASFRSSDKRLERLFEAGRETFRQNALDAFMDCPSRERAGWLCDSFFTARVAPDLRGDTSIENVLFENFLLPAKFEFLPDGMLPMCYPADHNDGVFIPNWAMWFVVQLEEYLERSGDRAMIDALKGRVLKLVEYLDRFRNSDGLLERLPSWVFIEWSDANKYVQDVNYPSNMLYAKVLSVAGRLHGLRDISDRAEAMRDTIRRQSFDGKFFVDNAVRRDGRLQVTQNKTEVCQYFAFFFDVATPQSHAELWSTLRQKFGPKRQGFPEVGAANSFIGNMLRIELLSRQGLSQQILDESIDYLLYMAERTGTLWENVGDTASCNHGFASHIVHTLFRDVLGLRALDRQKRSLLVRFSKLNLDWCEGTTLTAEGPISLSWRKKGDVIEFTCKVPEGYSVDLENKSDLPVVPARK